MKAATNLLGVFHPALGLLALIHMAGAVNPTEKENGLWLVVEAGCVNVLTYPSSCRSVY